MHSPVLMRARFSSGRAAHVLRAPRRQAMLRTALLLALAIVATAAPSATPEQRAAAMLKQMTLAEKVCVSSTCVRRQHSLSLFACVDHDGTRRAWWVRGQRACERPPEHPGAEPERRASGEWRCPLACVHTYVRGSDQEHVRASVRTTSLAPRRSGRLA